MTLSATQLAAKAVARTIWQMQDVEFSTSPDLIGAIGDVCVELEEDSPHAAAELLFVAGLSEHITPRGRDVIIRIGTARTRQLARLIDSEFVRHEVFVALTMCAADTEPALVAELVDELVSMGSVHPAPIVALARTKRDLAVDIASRHLPEHGRASAMGHLATTIAATDLERGRRLALQIANPSIAAGALYEIGTQCVDAEPATAIDLFDEALDLLVDADPARADFWRGRISVKLAALDRLQLSLTAAGGIATDSNRHECLAKIAQARAVRDRTTAIGVAESISDSQFRDQALLGIVRAIALTDPDDALATVRAITDEVLRSDSYAIVARAISAKDARQAEAAIDMITEPAVAAGALLHLAETTQESDPERSRGYWIRARECALGVSGTSTRGRRDALLRWIAVGQASTDLDGARETARLINAQSYERTDALRSVALHAADLDLALSLVREIGRVGSSAHAQALASVAAVRHELADDNASAVALSSVRSLASVAGDARWTVRAVAARLAPIDLGLALEALALPYLPLTATLLQQICVLAASGADAESELDRVGRAREQAQVLMRIAHHGARQSSTTYWLEQLLHVCEVVTQSRS